MSTLDRQTRPPSHSDWYYRIQSAIRFFAISGALSLLPVFSANAAYLLEIDTDGLDDAVVTYNPRFSFGQDTTTASSSVSSTAYGTTGGDSIFGGDGSSEPDTYVFTYAPTLHADNLAIPPDTSLGDGNTATGYPGGLTGTYRVYATWNFSTNVSGGLTRFTISTPGAADVVVFIDQTDGGAGTGDEWIFLGDIDYSVEDSDITVTQQSNSNTFVSMRSYGLLFEAQFQPEAYDFGDAPAPYPTLLADDGARHDAPGILLGGSRDGEWDGHPSASANGDDTTGLDDENGVEFEGEFTACTSVGVRVIVNILIAEESVPLSAWVDFNNNGSWNDAGEQVFTDLPVVTGDNNLEIEVPCDVQAGASFARFRISKRGGLSPSGLALDGEVEDYIIRLGDPPDRIFKDSFENQPQ